ncbi:hypothetical protein AAU61_05155 [Desulfocarbo indianensis]|nr:hypothetical protein AAU61_05155 [Desulfocarbo indianensis]
MSLRRFLAEPGALSLGAEVELSPEEAAHALKVLRLQAGAEVRLLDGAGLIATAQITALGKRSGKCRVLSLAAPPRPTPRLVICPGLAKNQAMELLAVKLCELMVDEVRPFVSSRSVPRLKDPAARRERWRRLSRQALKQCGAAWPPQWHEPRDLAELLEQPPEEALKLLLYEEASQGPSLAQALGPRQNLSEVWLLIGPEGGFAPQEVELAVSRGWLACGLAGAILRAETASLAGAAVVRFG